MSELHKRIAARYLGIEEEWITRDQIASICSSCAERMESMGIIKIRASALLDTDAILNSTVLGAKLPKGWNEGSAKKYWKTVGESHTKCVEGLKGKEEIDDPHAFCNWIKTLVKK